MLELTVSPTARKLEVISFLRKSILAHYIQSGPIDVILENRYLITDINQNGFSIYLNAYRNGNGYRHICNVDDSWHSVVDTDLFFAFILFVVECGLLDDVEKNFTVTSDDESKKCRLKETLSIRNRLIIDEINDGSSKNFVVTAGANSKPYCANYIQINDGRISFDKTSQGCWKYNLSKYDEELLEQVLDSGKYILGFTPKIV